MPLQGDPDLIPFPALVRCWYAKKTTKKTRLPSLYVHPQISITEKLESPLEHFLPFSPVLWV